MKTLGEKIRELREERDISLRELARRLGLSAGFMSDIELGRRSPTDKLFVSIAKVLDVQIEELKKYDTRPPVKDMKRLMRKNPRYAIAFRKLIDKKISPKELIDLAEQKDEKKEE